jgi:hypothetical protein
MKKRKVKLREKIKNKPKTRSHSNKGRKTKAAAPAPKTDDPVPVENTAPDMKTMSQVIMDFAAPLLETCPDEASERKAISLAIFVWNASLHPEPERKSTLEGYLAQCREAVPEQEFKTLSAYIDQLVVSKLTRFAHNRKRITNCTFGDFGDSRHIEVGYTME